MKMRDAALTAILVMALATGASAKEGGKTVEATLDYGTEAFDGLGGQIGVTAGFGYELPSNFQGRVDVSYFRSSTTVDDMNVTGTRVPVDVGIRYLYPVRQLDPNLVTYGQGALEVSFDHWTAAAGFPSESATRVGAVIGAGAEYALDQQWGALLNLQYHIIEDSYFTTGIGMAYHF
ncbi:MAG TPA: outer membrane beta-barrel protein [Geomonas sp.]|nr:outer membrane beta-barrel protein [Geomonas sp.]